MLLDINTSTYYGTYVEDEVVNSLMNYSGHITLYCRCRSLNQSLSLSNVFFKRTLEWEVMRNNLETVSLLI